MKLMGATWRRTGLSKVGLRHYYNQIHAGVVAAGAGPDLKRYVQNVVEDAVFYSDDAHVSITQPDGLTEMWHDNQDAFDRTFSTDYMNDVAWPDTLKYMDPNRTTGVMGDEHAILGASSDTRGLTKTQALVLLPHGASDRHVSDRLDVFAQALQAQNLPNLGVSTCSLVTELDEPHDTISRMLDLTGGLRGVAGITMFLQPERSWEMPEVAAALTQVTESAYGAKPFVLNMRLTPNVVIDGPGIP